MDGEKDAITAEEFEEFLSAKTYAEQFEILLKHSEKNQKIIEIRKKKMKNYNADRAVSREEISIGNVLSAIGNFQ